MTPRSKDGNSPNSNLHHDTHCGTVVASPINGIRNKQSITPEDIDKTEYGIRIDSIDSMIGEALPSGCSPDVRNKLSQSLQILSDYCTLFGFRPEGFDPKTTLDHWQLCSAQCGWIKFLKYKLSAFMSAFLKGELPKRPFEDRIGDVPSQLAGGTLGRFMRLLMKTPESWSFATGVLYLKKGFPRPGDDALAKALVDTKKVLTTVQVVPVSTNISRDGIKAVISRLVGDVFKGHTFGPKDMLHPFTPSVKANYTSSRSKFGTFGTLYDLGIIKDLWKNTDEPSLPFGDQVRAGYSKSLQSEEVLVDERLNDERILDFVIDSGYRARVDSIYREVYEKARILAMEEKADVKLVALAEALKVRVISKGPPLTYFALKPLQKFLHRIMRKQQCFQLIGTPTSTHILNDVMARGSGQFHSLDYQSATDLLDPEISNFVVQEICKVCKVPDDLTILFRKALTGHTVEGEPQLWGQLMGSVVSFIILCLVNAAVIQASYRITTGIDRNINDLPIMVNGDDGLVRAPPQFAIIWRDIASSVGLIPSVGKVYSHDSYCNINSTSYLFKDNEFQLIRYVNMGLVTGQTRASVGDKSSGQNMQSVVDDLDHLTVGARHHSLLDSCPSRLVNKVHGMFLKYNFKMLSGLRLPWYIPEKLGGVGLRPIIDYDYHADVNGDIDVDLVTKSYHVTASGHRCGPSKLDVMIALSLRDKVHKSFVVSKVPTQQPIQARQVWQTRIPETRNRSLVEISESDQSFMDLSTFYLTPSLVMVEMDPAKRLTVLRHNERAWHSLTSLWDTIPSGDDVFLD
jgi:hypothetical protein